MELIAIMAGLDLLNKVGQEGNILYSDCLAAVGKMDTPAAFVHKSTHSSVAIQSAIHKINQRCKYKVVWTPGHPENNDDLLIDPDIRNQEKWKTLSFRERQHQR